VGRTGAREFLAYVSWSCVAQLAGIAVSTAEPTEAHALGSLSSGDDKLLGLAGFREPTSCGLSYCRDIRQIFCLNGRVQRIERHK